LIYPKLRITIYSALPEERGGIEVFHVSIVCSSVMTVISMSLVKQRLTCIYVSPASYKLQLLSHLKLLKDKFLISSQRHTYYAMSVTFVTISIDIVTDHMRQVRLALML